MSLGEVVQGITYEMYVLVDWIIISKYYCITAVLYVLKSYMSVFVYVERL